MNKFRSSIIAAAVLLLLCCGCKPQSPLQESGTPAPVQTLSPQGENDSTPLPQPSPQPTPSPEPIPQITPPADDFYDPASDTDIIYESETLPPDPVSDTDLDSD